MVHAEVTFDQKHPILLTSKNYIVRLFLKREYERLGHAEARKVLSNIRLRFWLLNGLREIKHIIRNCVTCFRFHAQTSQQLMADLPKYRVSVSRPFTLVGIDFVPYL